LHQALQAFARRRGREQQKAVVEPADSGTYRTPVHEV